MRYPRDFYGMLHVNSRGIHVISGGFCPLGKHTHTHCMTLTNAHPKTHTLTDAHQRTSKLTHIPTHPHTHTHRCGKNVSVSQRIDQGVLRWFGHVERMGDERMAKRVYESDVRGTRRRGRLTYRFMWMKVSGHIRQ